MPKCKMKNGTKTQYLPGATTLRGTVKKIILASEGKHLSNWSNKSTDDEESSGERTPQTLTLISRR